MGVGGPGSDPSEHGFGALVGRLAHDLRAPLRHARAFTELAAVGARERLTTEESEHLERALGACEQAERLVGGLEDFAACARLARAAPEGGGAAPADEARCIGASLSLDVRFRGGGAGLRTRCPAPALRRLLRARLANVADWSGTRVAEVEIEASGTELLLHVDDFGPGIPPGERDRTLEPFRSGAEGRAGMGLAVGRRIAEACGGRLELAENSHGGLRVVLHLPRADELEAGGAP